MATGGRLILVLALVATLPGVVLPAQAQTDNTIVCESSDGDYHRCEVPTQGSVRLLRRLSWVPCEQGESWGFDPRGIWVDQGCSAEFAYGGSTAASTITGTTGAGNALVCESLNRQYRFCRASTQGNVALRRQISITRCVQGTNWGYDLNGIWVSENCRAEFVYGMNPVPAQQGATGAVPATGATLTCESAKGKYNYCSAATQNNVRLVKQLSKAACVKGETWDYDAGGIWVVRGCRAQFAYGVAQQAPVQSIQTLTVTCATAGTGVARFPPRARSRCRSNSPDGPVSRVRPGAAMNRVSGCRAAAAPSSPIRR